MIEKPKRPPQAITTFLSHVFCVIALLIGNIALTGLLYNPIMELFDISTSGFINLNGVFTAGVIWSILSLFAWIVVGVAKEQAGSYYRTLRISLMIFALLPLFLVFGFLFLADLK